MALKTNLCELSQCCWIQVSKHVTSEMCSVLHYTAERGCMAKIGEAWLGPPAFSKAGRGLNQKDLAKTVLRTGFQAIRLRIASTGARRDGNPIAHK